MMADVRFIELAGEVQEDPRGFSYFPWTGQVPPPREIIKTFHLVSILPGQVRGNHLHPGHEEWLYAFHGAGVLRWEAPTGDIKEKVLTGNRTLIHIPPGVAHALTNPGPEVLYLLAWRLSAGPNPPDPETLPRPLTPG